MAKATSHTRRARSVTGSHLPYALPPPPYSMEDPGCAPIELIKRAILASPDHRLQKRDIVAYILTAYPFFKTQKNFEQGISSFLTMYFLKVPREPGFSYSRWAINDSDVPIYKTTERYVNARKHPRSESQDDDGPKKQRKPSGNKGKRRMSSYSIDDNEVDSERSQSRHSLFHSGPTVLAVDRARNGVGTFTLRTHIDDDLWLSLEKWRVASASQTDGENVNAACLSLACYNQSDLDTYKSKYTSGMSNKDWVRSVLPVRFVKLLLRLLSLYVHGVRLAYTDMLHFVTDDNLLDLSHWAQPGDNVFVFEQQFPTDLSENAFALLIHSPAQKQQGRTRSLHSA